MFNYHIVRISDQNWMLLQQLSAEQSVSISDAVNTIIEKSATTECESGSIEQAQDYLKRAFDVLTQYTPPEPKPSKPFSEVAELWLEYRRGEDVSSSIKTYKSPINYHLIPHFGDRLVSEITKQDIVDLQTKIAAECGSKTANRVFKVLRPILDYALDNDWVEVNVSRAVKNLKAEPSDARNTNHRALNKEKEITPFLEKAKNQPVLKAALFCDITGVRAGEVGALTADDIDENYIHINRTITLDENGKHIMGDRPKTRESKRKIPINDTIRRLLDTIDMPTDGSTIFKTRRGKFVTSDTINQMIRRVRKQLEDEDGIRIGHFTSHAFRDTFATDYIHAHKDQGGDMKALQGILGHRTYAMTTDLYVHTLDEDLIAGMARMDDYA